jgi:hypothetical protein
MNDVTPVAETKACGAQASPAAENDTSVNPFQVRSRRVDIGARATREIERKGGHPAGVDEKCNDTHVLALGLLQCTW